LGCGGGLLAQAGTVPASAAAAPWAGQEEGSLGDEAEPPPRLLQAAREAAQRRRACGRMIWSGSSLRVN
ncbi:MAG TPA: hypothetical protein VMK12_15755, partial [Anaeromyxobacteraceae bacterium]|nr:hypothetical protein [Anaeromyxobacteraceae bacterium]